MGLLLGSHEGYHSQEQTDCHIAMKLKLVLPRFSYYYPEPMIQSSLSGG